MFPTVPLHDVGEGDCPTTEVVALPLITWKIIEVAPEVERWRLVRLHTPRRLSHGGAVLVRRKATHRAHDRTGYSASGSSGVCDCKRHYRADPRLTVQRGRVPVL